MNRISIVTICYNNLSELKTTCARIDTQTLKPYQHIIIDGSTKPDIREYLSSVEHPSYRSWISEPDKGISDAWNKGIRRATGEIIHIQNSGDYYYDDNILQKVKDTFDENPGIKWVHGKYIQYKGDMWVTTGAAFEPSKLYRGFRTVGHPTMFVRREMYDKHGLFNLDIKIVMDYDFLVRIANEPFVFIDYPLAVFTPGGQSNNLVKRSVKEMVQVYTHYHGKSFKNRLWAYRVRVLDKLTNTGFGRWLFQLKNAGKKPKEGDLEKPSLQPTPGKLNDSVFK